MLFWIVHHKLSLAEIKIFNIYINIFILIIFKKKIYFFQDNFRYLYEITLIIKIIFRTVFLLIYKGSLLILAKYITYCVRFYNV